MRETTRGLYFFIFILSISTTAFSSEKTLRVFYHRPNDIISDIDPSFDLSQIPDQYPENIRKFVALTRKVFSAFTPPKNYGDECSYSLTATYSEKPAAWREKDEDPVGYKPVSKNSKYTEVSKTNIHRFLLGVGRFTLKQPCLPQYASDDDETIVSQVTFSNTKTIYLETRKIHRGNGDISYERQVVTKFILSTFKLKDSVELRESFVSETPVDLNDYVSRQINQLTKEFNNSVLPKKLNPADSEI